MWKAQSAVSYVLFAILRIVAGVVMTVLGVTAIHRSESKLGLGQLALGVLLIVGGVYRIWKPFKASRPDAEEYHIT